MKKFTPIIIILALTKLIVHLIANRRYGFHRDELLHLSVSEHLDWGFMEFPPFIAVVGKLSYWLFDYSLLGVRIFPALAGVAILVLCCLMAKAMGGKGKSIFLAGVCVLAFLPFYRNHTLFQPVAFDQLFWTLGFYVLLRFINSEDKKYLYYTGIVLGLGLLNKYTMLIWAFGAFLGLLFYQKGKLFKSKGLYLSGGLALLIFLPNVIWQFMNDFPLLRHLQALRESQLDELNPWEFATEQLNYPFTLVISIIGLGCLLAQKELKKYRSLGLATLITFSTMWLLNAKPYYIFSVYPILFAAGAVQLEQWLSKYAFFIYPIAAILLATTIPYIPYATPILPIEKFTSYAEITTAENRVVLSNDYADMFGWEEQVALVDSLYQTLSTKEKKACVLWAENYGEAGALTILGEKYDLPKPISRHGSFWLWGNGNTKASVWISLGNEREAVGYVFEEITLVKMITHKYAIGEENNIPLYICRKPKLDLDQWWAAYEPYIFN